jgi:hypothetical protein
MGSRIIQIQIPGKLTLKSILLHNCRFDIYNIFSRRIIRLIEDKATRDVPGRHMEGTLRLPGNHLKDT